MDQNREGQVQQQQGGGGGQQQQELPVAEITCTVQFVSNRNNQQGQAVQGQGQQQQNYGNRQQHQNGT
ncbi:unnamed protein product [Meloidogyne enterolobii]|uniref:Uncharacterized protein n=1 Tax=Meloidogyne enterolobii TaxID=390850 RepID=A0ACB0Y2T6_MELEN